MLTPRRLAALAATALLLSGCQTTFDLVGVAVPLSATAERSYDGSYQGSIISTANPACPHEYGERVLMLGDGVLWYPYDADIFFAAPVNSDGVMQATDGDTTLKGKITGNHLVATVTSSQCTSQISMYYLYNHS